MKEFIEELKKFMAEDDEDIEGALEKEDIEKAEKVPDVAMKAIKGALNILNKYKKDMPDDVLAAIKTLAKYAAYGYPAAKQEDLDKAGAKLSKTTRDQLAKILGLLKESPKAINMLKTLLGQEVEKDEGGDGDEKLNPETLAKLEEYKELKKAKEEELTKEAEQKQEEKIVGIINKALKDANLKEIPKKKSIDDPGEGDKKKIKKGADDEDEDQWPSVYVPGLPESED